ncbi:MAG: LysR family transcriptional regulator [Calothrix sp. SM1_5_4]|nr:LysR family transcriptional regulator [Calothrix sp. SM1_5_4]
MSSASLRHWIFRMDNCPGSACMLEAGMKNDFNVDQIKKLWILDLIIQSGSLKGAAARAKISPSAVSQSLTALEKNVGKPLIIRDRGVVSPTQEALSILDVVRPAFEAFARLSEFGSQPVPKMAWLNFGTYESIAVDVLPGLLHRLREKLPDLRLGLRIGRTGQLLSMVRKGELCSAIVTEVDDLDKFYKALVFEDRLGIYVSARHPAAQQGFKTVEKLGLGSLASGKDGLPRYYTRFMKRLGTIKPTVLSESFETLRMAAVSGAIATVLPHRVATRSSDLVEITPKGDEKSTGAHKIFVVSQANCDVAEADFLAQESRRLLTRS